MQKVLPSKRFVNYEVISFSLFFNLLPSAADTDWGKPAQRPWVRIILLYLQQAVLLLLPPLLPLPLLLLIPRPAARGTESRDWKLNQLAEKMCEQRKNTLLHSVFC